jgi:protein phosphatase
MARTDSVISTVVRAFRHIPRGLVHRSSERYSTPPESVRTQPDTLRNLGPSPVFNKPNCVSGGLSLRAGFLSVTGNYRDRNEDCCYANQRDGLFIVADGVGGCRGGEIASQLLVDTIASQLLPAVRRSRVTGGELAGPMQKSIQAAQREMAFAATRDPDLLDMGSTLVLGVVTGGSLFLTHLGDSRAYMVRNDGVHRLTSDHTVVQALIDVGCLTTEKALHHPLRHVITEYVCAKRICSQVSIQEFPLVSGDRLLFTTDGLTDVLDEELIGFTLTHEEDPQVAADVLVKQALWNDSKDNVSCVVVHVDAPV